MESTSTEQLEINNPLISNNADETLSSSAIISNDQHNNDNQIEKEKLEENERFTKHSPLVTLLIFSIGPLSNVASLLFETISMYLITKRFGQIKDSYAIEILGFSGQYQNFLTVTGMFFGQCFITRMGSLIGGGQRENAIYLTSDLLKLTILVTLVYSVVMYFIIKPFLKFVGTPDYMIQPAWKYNLILMCFSLFTNLLTTEQSFIASIGRPILGALIGIASKIFQCLILDPLFLFAFKVPTMLMKLSKIVMEILFSISIFVVIFKGKFSIKPKIKQFFSLKFCKETLRSLPFPLPFTIAFVTSFIPPMIILKALTDIAKETEDSQSIGGVFAVFTQLSGLNAAIPSMLTTSFMQTGTHAYSSGNITRLKHLLFWSLLIALAISISFSFALIVFKRQIASIFIHDKEELDIAEKMLPIPFYTSFVSGFLTIAMALLMIIGKPLLVLIPTVLGPINLIISCIILKKIFKNDYVKLMHSYNISDIIGVLVYLGMFIYAVIVVKKAEKEKTQKHSDEKTLKENLLSEN